MEAVDFAKIDAYAWNRYMAERLHDSDVRKEGAHEKAVETARGMLAYGMPKDKVAEISGLSLEEVTAITRGS